jgi:hypothetical protein
MFWSWDILGPGMFWGLRCFETWDVLQLGCIGAGTFWGLGRFEAGMFWG